MNFDHQMQELRNISNAHSGVVARIQAASANFGPRLNQLHATAAAAQRPASRNVAMTQLNGHISEFVRGLESDFQQLIQGYEESSELVWRILQNPDAMALETRETLQEWYRTNIELQPLVAQFAGLALQLQATADGWSSDMAQAKYALEVAVLAMEKHMATMQIISQRNEERQIPLLLALPNENDPT